MKAIRMCLSVSIVLWLTAGTELVLRLFHSAVPPVLLHDSIMAGAFLVSSSILFGAWAIGCLLNEKL
jgi:hypothetical protein